MTKASVVAIGNFDGVHLGHQALLREARAIANSRSLDFLALTFAPHPRAFFNPAAAPAQLTSPRLKDILLRQAGATPVTLDFNAALANLSADTFIKDILQARLNATHVVVGEDFTFGRGRQGTVAQLQAALPVTSAPLSAGPDGQVYSSSCIRDLVAKGQMEAAARFLGRPYIVETGIQGLLWPSEGIYQAFFSPDGINWQHLKLNVAQEGPKTPLQDGFFIAFSSETPSIALKTT